MKRLRILEVLGVLVLLGWTGLAHATLVSRIDGFFSPDDGLLHAIVGTSDKKVYDVTWTDGSAPTITLLHQFNTLIQDVAGYYSPNDHNRHAIVALIDNTVWEVYYRPSIGVFVDQLATINPSY